MVQKPKDVDHSGCSAFDPNRYNCCIRRFCNEKEKDGLTTEDNLNCIFDYLHFDWLLEMTP